MWPTYLRRGASSNTCMKSLFESRPSVPVRTFHTQITPSAPAEARYSPSGLNFSAHTAFLQIKATEGTSIVDSRFKDNFTQAREYGFIRGAYHFWSNKSSARDQAYFFLDNVLLIDGDLPPVLDIENKPKDVSIEDFQRDVLTWLHIVEDRYHVKPIIYTYYKFKMNYLDAPVFDDYPYWIAHYYVDKVEYPGEWKFWQHTDAGRLPGINGYVDFNIYNGSYYDLRKLTIGN